MTASATSEARFRNTGSGKEDERARKTGERLSVTSTPEGATVAIDRTNARRHPSDAERPAVPGRHAVTLESAGGTVQRSVDVKADQTATVEGADLPGLAGTLLAIRAQIQTADASCNSTNGHQTSRCHRAGTRIVVVSRELGYSDSRVVDVRAGEVTRLSIEPPQTTLTVAAMLPAQVWLDGTHIGAAPVVDVPIDLGTHQLVVRHPTAGEERRTITATSAPVRVEIDFDNQN